ncbi:unnamed protein product [Dicrocoelium dendriticum]|nr:unnamed protein product [Dicrocoelium dendriticum]
MTNPNEVYYSGANETTAFLTEETLSWDNYNSSSHVLDWNSHLVEVNFGYANDSFLTATLTEAITSTQSAILGSSTSFSQPAAKCVKEELSEPDFPRYACEGSKITSWIAAVFLLSMITFGIIKCLTTHGPRNIFDLRRNGVSFPQRPEFFVLICSSLPLIFTVLTRPLFTPLSLRHDIFIRGWGLAQTRFFFDLFTRTASIYHLVYWVYRTPIIHLLWRIRIYTEHMWTKWKNRPKPIRQKKELIARASLTTLNRTKPPARRPGRTTDYGYGKRRRRSKSIRSDRSNGKSFTSAHHSPSDPLHTQPPQSSDASGTHSTSQRAPVISAAAVNLISPQPLLSSYMLGDSMGPSLGTAYSPFPQGAMNHSSGLNMYNPSQVMLPQGGGYGSMYGMPMGMGVGQPGFMPQSYPTQGSSFAPGPIPNTENQGTVGTASSTLVDSAPDPDKSTKVKATVKPALVIPPPTRAFCYLCKRIIPGSIYITSFVITIPSVLAFEVDTTETAFVVARCTHMCRSYFYYDLVALVTVPTIMIIVAFYHGALAKKQLNGGTKMTYRLRCYYVTFILLNIPMFVLMLTSIGFRLSARPYRDIYGTGILIAMTAYHANFALKPAIYTTGCNCICCTDACFRRFPVIDKFVTFFTTPVYMKDREAGLDSNSLAVYPEKAADKSIG